MSRTAFETYAERSSRQSFPKFVGFPNLGVPFFGGPHIRDPSILGSILGFPYFGKLPYVGFGGGGGGGGLGIQGWVLGFSAWGLLSAV